MSNPLTRRALLHRGIPGILAAGLAPQVVSARLFGKSAPSNRLTIGLVGNGLICNAHAGTLLGLTDDCRVIATCDVVRAKAEKMRDRVETSYGKAKDLGGRSGDVRIFATHEELVARDDIDIVFVCTPDHWHAAVSAAAMRAGKDVYCEKPLTLTVREGRTLVNIARSHGRILQTGTQQRSNKSFRKAAEIVRNGWIGDIKVIRTRLGKFPEALPLPEEPVPAGFDYDRWLGPTPWRPYNEKRVKGDYGGGWRCFFEYGGRKNGDWGAHHFDIIQNAFGMDGGGPVEFIPKGYEGCEFQTHVYANGVRVERDDDLAKSMIEFRGTKGTVWVSRDDFLETDPPELAARPLRGEDVHLYASDHHHLDFFNCVRTRRHPIADVEVGHRTATVCHLNVIAAKVGRPVRWDPAKEEIIGDPLAASLLDRPRRAGYALLEAKGTTMNHCSSLALRLFAAFAFPAFPALHAAERAPALTSLTYSGDQSALEALDRELIAAGKDTAKLGALRASLLAVLRHRDATFAGRQAAGQRLGLVLAALPPAEGPADYRPLPAFLEDPLQCEVARLALESAPGAVVDQMFVSALEKASGAHRVSLINALGSRRTASAVTSLARLANDAEAATALAAIRALTSIGGAAADAALKSATGATPAARAAARLKVVPGLEREAALASLREIETDAILPSAVRLAAFRQLADRDPAATLGRLQEALQGSDWYRKEVALEAITSAPSPERINLLVTGLPAFDAATQVAAIGILARTGAAAAVPAVSSAARSSKPEVREAALEALGYLPGSKETVPLLLGAAAGTEDSAKAARRGLARLKGTGVSEAILTAAEKDDNSSRASALESIASRNLTEGIPLLLRARESSEAAIRNAALAALAEIGPYSAQAQVIAWAVAATDDTERTRALRAVVAITQRGNDAASRAKPLFAAIESAQPEAAERLLGALPRLGGEEGLACAARIAARPDAKLSAAAVATLARWPDSSALPALAALAKNAADSSARAEARAAATQSLEKARDAWTPARSEALRQLLDASKDAAARKNLVALLSRANDETAASLAAALQSDAALGADARYAAGAIASNRRGAPKARANPASGAGNTVDGKTSSRWTVPSLGEEWLELDFHVSRPFRRITLDQTARAAEFPERYSVHVTDDPKNPGPAVAEGAGQRNRTVIELPAAPAGRYVIIRNLAERKDSSWSVCEVYLD